MQSIAVIIQYSILNYEMQKFMVYLSKNI